jgi:hypothetical protein
MARKAWQFRSEVQSEVCSEDRLPSLSRPTNILLVEHGPAALTIAFEQGSLPIMGLLRGLLWLILFLVLAFCFVVLFEYGPRDFANGSKKEFARLKSFVVKQTEKVEKPKKR